MKSSEFAEMLRSIPSADLSGLAKLFDAMPSGTVAAAVKRIGSDDEAPIWADGASAARRLSTLRPLLRLVAKAGVVKDVDAVVAMLERGPAAPATRRFRASAKAGANPAVVAAYLGKLSQALGDERRFADVFARLEADTALSTADLRALAKEFAQANPRSKADALKKIWNRQQSLLGFEAKARATDGRSAA